MADVLFSVFCSVHIYVLLVNTFYDTESSVTKIQARYRNLRCKLKESFLNVCATLGSPVQLWRYEEKMQINDERERSAP